MSFLDRVTKVVGDAVDRGKKEVDQFVQIQRINGQINDFEKKIDESNSQIQQAKVKLGEMALEMLRAGTLASPEMQALVDQISGVEKQIAEDEAAIAEKRVEIEKIKAEDKADNAPAAAAPDPPTVPPVPAAGAPASRFCPQCGTPASGTGAFCAQCGAKLA